MERRQEEEGVFKEEATGRGVAEGEGGSKKRMRVDGGEMNTSTFNKREEGEGQMGEVWIRL